MAFHFLEPQCFKQHRLGLGAWRIPSEGDGLIVGKLARAGILLWEGHEARHTKRSGFSGGLEFGQLALGRFGLLLELPGLPAGLGFDCRGGALLKIEARGLGNINLRFRARPRP